MPKDRMPDKHWDTLVTELRGLQEDGQEAWGGVDDMLIARYLAGDCDPQERELVEQAAQSSPDVRECIDLARQALGSASAEPVLPLNTGPQQLYSPRVIRRGLPAVFRNLAVAASILALLAGGAYALVRIKSDSAALAKVTAELGRLQEVVRQAGAGTPVEVPKRLLALLTESQAQEKPPTDARHQVAYMVGHDSLETRVTELEKKLQIREHDEQIAATNLRNTQEEAIKRIKVQSMEEVAALRRKINNLQADVKAAEATVAALNRSCPAPNGTACVAYCAPCAQPCCPPVPCSGCCACPCQASVSVGCPVPSPAIASYR